MPILKLKSSENNDFEIDMEAAKRSGTIILIIRRLLKNVELKDADDYLIPLHNVNTATLRIIVCWLNQHKNDPEPEEDDDDDERRSFHIPEWDAGFLKVEKGMLYNIIAAANYLDIKGLMEMSCQTVADMIKGKNPGEIRKMFNVKNDFAPADE